MDKPSVIVFGTGNIGTDLLAKLRNSKLKNQVIAIGRSKNSQGIVFCRNNNIPYLTDGIKSLEKITTSESLSWVLDASSSSTHTELVNIMALQPAVNILDLTPSNLSKNFIPSINDSIKEDSNHIGLISCGAQSSIPIIKTLNEFSRLSYVEVVTSLSSKSVGVATRNNIDDYIDKTQDAIIEYVGVKESKAILIINPAEPPINMSVSIFFKFTDELNITNSELKNIVVNKINLIEQYIPKIYISGEIQEVNGNFLLNLTVLGHEDYLPEYAGNLDILTHIARKIVLDHMIT